MAELTIDTDKVKECGEEISRLSMELNTALNALFLELENLENNDVWRGVGAASFIKSLQKEKIDYYDLKDSLYKFGKTLCFASDKYNNYLEESKK